MSLVSALFITAETEKRLKDLCRIIIKPRLRAGRPPLNTVFFGQGFSEQAQTLVDLLVQNGCFSAGYTMEVNVEDLNNNKPGLEPKRAQQLLRAFFSRNPFCKCGQASYPIICLKSSVPSKAAGFEVEEYDAVEVTVFTRGKSIVIQQVKPAN